MPKINHEEYEVLKGLDDKWKWIARDKDNTLVMGAGKNERYLDGWFPPENIGDSLVVDETNAVKDVSEYGNLFQFIQWEDESPYNIQELIEEYLYDNRPKLFIDGQEQSFEFIEESEEKEVNKQKLIKKWESAIEAAEFYGRGKEDRLIEYMRNFVDDLNQLDEPEVLSQEWIDGHKETIFDLDEDFETEFIKADDLQNLLVPKQEEVDRAYKDGYEKGKQHTFYKGYLEGLTEGERQTAEYFESITEEPSKEQVWKYLSEHGIEVVDKEPETVASVIADFYKSLERLKEVLGTEVEELEE